jgi:hypothetical protein
MPLEDVLDSQEQWLHGLERGKPIQDVTLAFAPNTRYSLEVFDRGRLYQYIKGMYPNTGTLYGLYFEAGQLKALLLDQDVTDFFQCEYAYRHESDQWLRSGMAPASDWIESRNLIGRDFDGRVTHNGAMSSDGTDAIEAIAHLPMAAIAAPVYGVYVLAGGSKRDNRAAIQTAEALGRLLPGTATEADLKRLLGSPERRSSWVGGEVWIYIHPTIFIGTAAGIVMWKESGRVETPRNASTRLGKVDCEEMRTDR